MDANLEPTLKFYIEALGSEKEALALVAHTPVLLACSLTKRLEPRLRDAQDAGIIIDAACLTRLAIHTNEQWQASLASKMKKVNKGKPNGKGNKD